MHVDVSDGEEGQKVLSITIEPAEVDSVIDSSYRRLAGSVRVPGFRPGKAPRPIILRTYGEERFFELATDEAMRRFYPKALQDSGVVPLDQGTLDAVDEEVVRPNSTFTFRARVAVMPEVVLPDYGEIKIPAPPTDVSDSEVDSVIESLRGARSTYDPAPNKSAEIGDAVKVNITGRFEGREVVSNDDLDFPLRAEDDELETDGALPGLSKELVGSRRGDIKEISLKLPDTYDDAEMAGRSLPLNIVVKDVLARKLPMVDDSFAQEVSAASTVSELRDAIRHNLLHEKHDEATGKVATEAVDSLIARANLTVPEALVSAEQDRLLREQERYFQRGGLSFEQLLMATKKTREEYLDDLKPAALRRVKRDLLLDKIAESEELTPDPHAVDQELTDMITAMAKSERDKERLESSDALKRRLEDEMRRQMALAKLVESASGLRPSPHHDDEHEVEEAPVTAGA
jgi:trigger factor